MTKSDISLGSQTFDPANGLLRGNGMDLRLGQRAAALLQTLIEADGQPVTKSDLLEAAWPGMIVEEGNLTVQIAALRKALGSRPDGQEWIVTMPRVGYRLLIAESSSSLPEPSLPVLAVLPFANLGGDPEQDYFADGVVEDIITALSRFKSFAVIARNSSFTYKGRAVDVRQVALELGVRYVLEGSVRRAGNRLRISARLADGITGSHIWAEHFDGEIEEVFDFQDRISANVVSVVEPRIQRAEIERSRRDRPESVAAYDLYLRALAIPNDARAVENASAYALLTKALEIEPDNAIILANAARRLAHRNLMSWTPIGPDDPAKCAELTRRALKHASDDATVLAFCGDVLVHVIKDYQWAIAVLRAAVEANPNDQHVIIRAGIVTLHCGDIDDALAYFQRAIQLSPRDPDAHLTFTGIAHVQMIRGDYLAALDWAARALTLSPNNQPTYWMLIAANAQLGRMAEAHRLMQEFQAIASDASIASIWAGQPQMDPGRCAAILDGLRLAGLAEE